MKIGGSEAASTSPMCSLPDDSMCEGSDMCLPAGRCVRSRNVLCCIRVCVKSKVAMGTPNYTKFKRFIRKFIIMFSVRCSFHISREIPSFSDTPTAGLAFVLQKRVQQAALVSLRKVPVDPSLLTPEQKQKLLEARQIRELRREKMVALFFGWLNQ